jgi:Ca2+-binding RTX toxin-like protein
VHGLIVGGTGNDSMVSNSAVSNDTYVLFSGDGTDTIQDIGNTLDTDVIWIATGGAALSTLDIFDSSSSTSAGNLLVQYGATDTVTVTSNFQTSLQSWMERIGFDNGSYQGYALGSGFYSISTDDIGPRDATAGVNTVLTGDSLANTLNGNSGRDLLFGYDGDDTLNGAGEDDLLVGGAGTDRLVGGDGNDVMIGGAQSDTFAFGAGFGQDRVVDFDPTLDYIEFVDELFADSNAVLSASTDVAGGALIAASDGSALFLAGLTVQQLLDYQDHFLFS